MILVFLYWIFIYIIGLLFGDFFINKFLFFDSKKTGNSTKVILGLVFIYTTAIFWSFFFKIGIIYNIILVVSSLFLLYKNNFRISGFKIFNVGLIFLIVLILSAFSAIKTNYYDEGLYYIQWVKWLNSYGIVKGIANLHQRFGFNSSVHILQAVFSLGYTSLKFNDLNGFLLSLLLIDSVNTINSPTKEKNNVSTFSFFSFLVIFFFSLRTWTTMSVDPIILIFSIYILKHFLIYFESNFEYDTSLKIIIILCFFTFTIKPTSFVFIVPVVVYFLNSLIKKRHNITFFITKCFFIILAPWIISNIFISGYMFFPFKLFDVFNFEWKVPNEALWSPESRLTTKQLENHFNLKFSEIPTLSWLKHWILNLSIYFKSVLLLTFLSLIITIRGSIKAFQVGRASPFIIINVFYLFIIVSSLITFGPNFRFFNFAYCILIISTLSLVYLKSNLNLFFKKVFINGLIMFFFIYHSYDFIYNRVHYREFFTKTVLLPFQHSSKNDKIFTLNGQKYFVSNDTDQCWNSPLPCAVGGEALFNIYENKGLSLINKEIKNGFKIIKRPLK